MVIDLISNTEKRDTVFIPELKKAYVYVHTEKFNKVCIEASNFCVNILCSTVKEQDRVCDVIIEYLCDEDPAPRCIIFYRDSE